jgi:uncharacterized membrane protein YkvI
MEHKEKILLALGAGLFLSDLIPTPADAVYFNYVRNNRLKLENEEITPKKYWTNEAIAYYGFNAVWWAGVIGVSYYFGKDFKQKRKIFIGLIAGGVTIAVLNRNIKKDTEIYQNK